MSSDSELVEVPFDSASDQAILLLAAAEDKGYDPSVVQTFTGGFRAPKDVVEAAKLDDSKSGDRAQELRDKRDEEGPQVTTLGAGPLGRTDTNAGDDADQGTVQADEGEAEGKPSPQRQKRTGKRAAKKSTANRTQE